MSNVLPVLLILTDRQALKHLSSNECFNLHFQAQLRKELNAEKFKNEVLSRYLNCTWLYDLINVAWLFMSWLCGMIFQQMNFTACFLPPKKDVDHTSCTLAAFLPLIPWIFYFWKPCLDVYTHSSGAFFKGCMLHSLSALQSWALFLMLPFPHHMEVIGWLTTSFVSCGSCLLNKAVVNYYYYN